MKLVRWALTAVLLGGVLAGAEHADAQSQLLTGTPDKGLWLEASHPAAKDYDVTIASSAWYASGRHPLVSGFWGVAEIPFAYGRLHSDAGGGQPDGSTVLGNPYLGIEYAAADRVWLEGGVRLPLTTADEGSFGDVVGYLADPLRGEAFMDDVVPLSAAVAYRHPLVSGVTLQARGGVTSMVWTGEDDEGETITALDYGVLAHYPMGAARFGGGITGRWDVSADDDGFSENSLHQLGLNADYMFRGVRPGVSLRIPLDREARDLVSTTVGLYIQVPLR